MEIMSFVNKTSALALFAGSIFATVAMLQSTLQSLPSARNDSSFQSIVDSIQLYPAANGDVDELLDTFLKLIQQQHQDVSVRFHIIGIPESRYHQKSLVPTLNTEQRHVCIYNLGKSDQSFGYLICESNATNPNFKIFEEICTAFNLVLSTTVSFMRLQYELTKCQIVNSMMTYRTIDGPIDQFLRTTISCIDKLIKPELASVYLCDQMRREIFICASKDGIEGLTMSFDQGVAGHVASSGLSVVIENAYEDKRFLSSVDKLTGQKTKSIMCIPVPGFTSAAPIALVQVINKQSGGNFTTVDEESLRLIVNELSLGLRAQARALYDLKTFGARKTSDLVISKLEDSLLQEYGSSIPRYKYRVIADTMIQCASSSDATLNKSTSESAANLLEKDDSPKANTAILDFEFDPTIVNDARLLDLAMEMFAYYKAFDTLRVDRATMRRFLESVRNLYHSNNEYHNFKHAWSVLHSTFEILVKGADKLFKPVEVFAILVAAFCHDIDHPGHNNQFEIVNRSTLALLYSDDAVLERHHCAMTQKLMNQDDMNILSGFSRQDAVLIRKLITAAIMATDMSLHFDIVDKLVTRVTAVANPGANAFDPDDLDSKKILVGIIVHSADISSQTLPRKLAMFWTDAISNEFSSQVELEKQLGLEPTVFMSGLASELKRVQLQFGFIRDILLPLWSPLADLFPELKGKVLQAMENKEFYQQRMAELNEQSVKNE